MSKPFQKGTVYQIDLRDLRIDPDQPRQVNDEEAIVRLEGSIKQRGILEPIIFREDNEGNKLIVAGAQRFLAAQKAGEDKIPATFHDGDKYFLDSYIENVHRNNLHPIDDAEALARIQTESGVTQAELAELFDSSRTSISEKIALTHLSDEVKNKAREIKTLSLRKMLSIKRETDDESIQLEMLEALKNAIEHPDADNTSETATADNNEDEVTPESSADGTTTLSNLPKKVERAISAIKKTNTKVEKYLEWQNLEHVQHLHESLLELKQTLDTHFAQHNTEQIQPQQEQDNEDTAPVHTNISSNT